MPAVRDNKPCRRDVSARGDLLARQPAAVGEGELEFVAVESGLFRADDFAQLINRNTREVLRIRPGMFGGENMQHIGILTDGTVVIVTRRDRVGPVFRYPIDFWGFLRTANKPKKLEWREYKEVYPNLPIFLPPKATEKYRRRNCPHILR